MPFVETLSKSCCLNRRTALVTQVNSTVRLIFVGTVVECVLLQHRSRPTWHGLMLDVAAFIMHCRVLYACTARFHACRTSNHDAVAPLR